MVEPHAAVPRRPGHGGLGVVVKAETEVWESVRKLQPKPTFYPLGEGTILQKVENTSQERDSCPVLIFVEPLTTKTATNATTITLLPPVRRPLNSATLPPPVGILESDRVPGAVNFMSSLSVSPTD